MLNVLSPIKEITKISQKTGHPIKITALSYLTEALSQERYEELHGIIEVAKEFGATQWEIKNILIRRW